MSKVTLQNDKIVITHKKNSDENQLQIVSSMQIVGKITRFRMNTVALPKQLFDTMKNNCLAIFNPQNGQYLDIVAVADDTLPQNSIKVTNNMLDFLQLAVGADCIICHNKNLVFEKVLTQKIDLIPEDYVTISEKDVGDNGLGLFHSAHMQFEITNNLTHESFILKRSHIKIDTSLPKGTIRLNRKQRCFLSTDLLQYLTDEHVEQLKNSILTEEDLQLIFEVYPQDKDFELQSTLPFERQKRAFDLIKRVLKPMITFKPVVQSFAYKKSRSLSQAIADLYVGKSTVALMCKRPYESDESSNVVRMTNSNMKLLGLEETDMVTLTYKNKRVNCRVLQLDDAQKFDAVNSPIDTNLAIGIPSHIRKKLGMPFIDSCVKIDRNTKYILGKSINEQVVPILLTVFSANAIFQKVLLSVLFSILLIPIVVFLNLSSKRNMRIK